MREWEDIDRVTQRAEAGCDRSAAALTGRAAAYGGGERWHVRTREAAGPPTGDIYRDRRKEWHRAQSDWRRASPLISRPDSVDLERHQAVAASEQRQAPSSNDQTMEKYEQYTAQHISTAAVATRRPAHQETTNN